MLPYTHVIVSLLMHIHVYIIMHATYHYMYMYVWIFGFIIFVVFAVPSRHQQVKIAAPLTGTVVQYTPCSNSVSMVNGKKHTSVLCSEVVFNVYPANSVIIHFYTFALRCLPMSKFHQIAMLTPQKFQVNFLQMRHLSRMKLGQLLNILTVICKHTSICSTRLHI